ncbi:MAG TPA: hypothetical protein VF682_19160 [Pseudomonas sp.]
MRFFLAVTGLSAFLVGAESSAAAHMLQKGSLICDSEEKYEMQIDRISKKNYELLPGCGLTKAAVMVELVNASLMGATEVYAPSVRGNVFTDRNSLK